MIEQRGLSAVLRLVGRHLMVGLSLLGQAHHPIFGQDYRPLLGPDYQPLLGPDHHPLVILPPGHPERMAPETVTSPIEVALWTSLGRKPGVWQGPA